MTQPDPTADYPRDVPPDVLAMADKAVLRMHEMLDGAPLALVVNAYRAGRDAAWADAIRVIEGAKAESTDPDYQRGREAYRATLLAGLRISARLSKRADADQTTEENDDLMPVIEAAKAWREWYAASPVRMQMPSDAEDALLAAVVATEESA